MALETLGGVKFESERLIQESSKDFPHGFGERWTPKRDDFDFCDWFQSARNKRVLATRAMLWGAIAIAPTNTANLSDWIKQDWEGDERPLIPWHTDPAQKLLLLCQPPGNQRNEPTHIGPGRVIQDVLKRLARRKARSASKTKRAFIDPEQCTSHSTYEAEYKRIANAPKLVNDLLFERYRQIEEETATAKPWADRWVDLNVATLEQLRDKVYRHDWQNYTKGSVLVMRTSVEHHRIGRNLVHHCPVLHSRMIGVSTQAGPPLFARPYTTK